MGLDAWFQHERIFLGREGEVCEATEQLNKAYNQLNGMKERGIMQPADEQNLKMLRQKVEAAAAAIMHPLLTGNLFHPPDTSIYFGVSRT